MCQARERLCVALDTLDRDQILKVVDELVDLVGYVKLNSAFTLHGPELVRAILERGAKVFLDLKLHDIPNTLAGYGRAVTELGVHVVTLHPAGGLEMLKAAATAVEETARELGTDRPKLIGIALLTSIDQQVLNDEMNIPGSVEHEVFRKALLAAEAGLDGIVCAPAEIELVRPHLPDDFMYVTPGTRSPGGVTDDHKRIATHAEAISAGSSLLVVGRPILAAADPAQATRDVLAEIQGAR